MYRPRGRMRGNIAIWLLLLEVMQIGLDHIPPVTLAALATQVAIYLNIFQLFGVANIPSLDEACVSAFHVWYRNDWRRLFLASVFHADDWHLYFNMVSFLSKAITLERHFGSAGFLCLLGVFSVLVNIVVIALAMLAEAALGDSSYVTQCAVGFSGVLFALKVVTTHLTPPGYQYMMFIPMPIPTAYACWVELILIQLLLPNVSFIGHLAGILVGLMFVKGPMNYFLSSGPSYTYHTGPVGSDSFDEYYQARSFTSARYDGDRPRTSGRRTSDRDYNSYTGGLNEEEQLQRALRQSRTSQYSPRQTRPLEPIAPPVELTERLYPDLSAQGTEIPPGQGALNREDLRRRRLMRFSRHT